ncbi:hypothetical protein Trydic_g4518 [Trypoxylus dichotomus]
MNFNANTSSRQPFGRKIKRVSDVNAMGYSPYTPANPYNNTEFVNQQQYPTEYVNTQPNFNESKDPGYGVGPQNSFTNVQQQGINVFGQPIVQDIAIQYGQQLANTGKSMTSTVYLIPQRLGTGIRRNRFDNEQTSDGMTKDVKNRRNCEEQSVHESCGLDKRASTLNVPRSSIHCILGKDLRLNLYKLVSARTNAS